MPNVITVGSSPAPQIIGNFLDQYNANRRADQQNALGQAELAQRAKAHQDDFSIQSGQLADMQNRFKLIEAEYKDKKETADAQPYIARLDSIHDAKQSLAPNDPQQAALDAQAKSLMDDLQQNHPELLPPVKIHYLAPILTPERQATLNTNKFSAQQTGAAASGGTDPNAVNFTTKKATGSFMPAEGFTQQQATDLARRDAAPDSAGTPTPDLSKKIPTPSGNAVSDFEARATNAMPTSPESLTSQTAITQTGMQGQTARDVASMQIKAQAPLQAAQTREAAAKASIAEGQAKLASGDPTAVNSFALGVYLNPSSYDSLTPEAKRLAESGLGGRAPSKLNAQEQSAQDAARSTVEGVNRASAILDKWAKRGVQITGPMIGRYNAATQTWGDQVLPSGMDERTLGELQGDIAGLQQNFGINKLNELHAVIGGRVPAQMMGIIAAPNIAQNPAMLQGALAAMKQIAQDRGDAIDRKIWNGIPPNLSGATADALHRALTQNQNVITTHDGLKWTKNPDGSMTQVP